MDTEYDFSAATDTARDKVQQALTTARDRTGDVVARGGQYVSERPAASVLSAFALGLAVGAVAVLAYRSSPAPTSRLSATLDESRDQLAELFGSVAETLRGPVQKTYSSVADGASTLSDSISRVFEKVRPPKKFGWW